MQKLIVYVCLFFFLSCEKDPFRHFDCEELISALTENDETAVKNEIEELTTDLAPDPQVNDPIGHKTNLQTLSDRINSHCTLLEATVSCYACIETFPALSEIQLEYELNGEKIEKIVDIVTAENDILHFGGLHDQGY
jgi:hypothetical protein